MERAVLVYTTYPSVVEAELAGRLIVERRLAACVNILPGMISHYWWQGALERGEEAVMIFKTRASLAEKVSAAVKASHSYTTPSIWCCRSRTAMPITCGGFSQRQKGRMANREWRMESRHTPSFLLFATRHSPFALSIRLLPSQ